MPKENNLSGFKFTLFVEKFKPLLFLILAMMFFTISPAQTIIPLYQQVPNSKRDLNFKEKTDTANDGLIIISKVSLPEIEIFKAPGSNRKNTGVIICPGGGYSILAYNLEGTDVAKILNSWGVTAVVLKYRLPDDAIMKDKSIGPLQDAQRAIQYVREHADELKIDPQKVGIMGFSAGGHLASTASTHFEKSYIDNPKNISLRPDFSILGYPVISFTDSIGHMGSRENLIGKNPSEQKIENFSNELQVTKNTPKTFLFLAADDDVVKPANSIRYYEALLKNNVPAEMHVFQNGGHGFGTHLLEGKDNWMDLLRVWMTHNGF